MEYPVWAMLDDGPLVGMVLEVDVNDRLIQVITDDEGTQQYRRYCWGAGRAHRVAHFRFTKTLVI